MMMAAAVTDTMTPARVSRLRGSNGAIWGLSIPLAAIVLTVIVLPMLPMMPPPDMQNLSEALLPPAWLAGGTWEHLLGTDQLGRDVFARIIAGGRLTMLIAVAALIVGAIPGIILGLLAGYFRGVTDAVVSRLIEVQLALPYILIALAIISGIGNSIPAVVAVLALTGWAQYSRVLRGQIFSLRERSFVSALRSAGVPAHGIVFRHLLPNVMASVIVLSTLQVALIMLAESALSFLGLGVVPPAVSWGSLIAEGRSYLGTAWWIAAFPGLTLTITSILVSLLGDALQTRLDPRKRRY